MIKDKDDEVDDGDVFDGLHTEAERLADWIKKQSAENTPLLMTSMLLCYIVYYLGVDRTIALGIFEDAKQNFIEVDFQDKEEMKDD